MLGILNSKKAQSLLEYAIIVAAVSAALIAMQPYVRRAFSSVVRQMDDNITPR